MSDYFCFLITLLNVDQLAKCALRIRAEDVAGDCIEYPMEPENRAQLHALLPLHAQSIGPIVAVEQIFEVFGVDECKK